VKIEKAKAMRIIKKVLLWYNGDDVASRNRKNTIGGPTANNNSLSHMSKDVSSKRRLDKKVL
jgi:hypothetical protein